MRRTFKVKAHPSETESRTFEIDYLDLGFTEDTWENLTDEQKRKEIQLYLDGCEQPYWAFDEIIEE